MNAEHGVSALFHSALSVGVLSPQPRACVCTPAESAGRLAAEPGGGGSPVTSAGQTHALVPDAGKIFSCDARVHANQAAVLWAPRYAQYMLRSEVHVCIIHLRPGGSRCCRGEAPALPSARGWG